MDAIKLVASAGRWTFAGVITLFAISGIGIVVQLLIGRELLNELMAGGTSEVNSGVWAMLFGVVIITTVIAFATAVGSALHRLLTERLIKLCGQVTLEAAGRSPLSDFDKPEFHDKMLHANRGSMSPMHIAVAVPNLVSAAISSAGIGVGLLVVNPWLVPVTLLSCVPLWLSGTSNSRDMYSFSFGNTPDDRERQKLEKMMYGRESAAEIRAFGLGNYLTGKWSDLYRIRLDGIDKIVRRFLRTSTIAAVVSSVVLTGVLVALLFLVRQNNIDLGSAVAACAAVLLLANQSQKVATSLSTTLEHRMYVDEFMALRRWRAGERQVPVKVEPFRKLRADNISFGYPAATTKAIESVSFDIKAGEVIAIVGHNGSGKTTLAKLLCGLYAPASGTVFWDDDSLTEISKGQGVSEVGVVFQDFARYWFSAFDNIAVGDVSRLDDKSAITASADIAGAGKFLESLPNGFDTPLAPELDGGVDLSLGQWQRIAIARVFFRNASFIVLDEPTASLDAEAEAELFETIQRLREGRTVVMISHRFSTVRSADRILVMHEGRLVEEGSHDELMAVGGRYAHLYTLQSSAYADSPS